MPQQYIDFAYVKENASFARVVAGYNLKLLGRGSQRSLLCPFHPERKPSCKVDLERNIWHCFGCEAKGNVLEFVARLEGDKDDLRAAALKIAELCEIATAAPREAAASAAGEHGRKGARPQRGGARRARVARAWSAPAEEAEQGAEGCLALAPADLTKRQIHGAAAKNGGGRLTKPPSHGVAESENTPLTFQLKLDPAHAYLAERGLSADVVSEFGLGYCSRGVMAGRICIPIHNERSELVAYAGRWPGEAVPDGQERYKLPAKFQKSGVLFNLHRVSDAEHVVLVEGYWSAIRLHALGVPVAALMGWSASADQIALLGDRGTRFITLLLDGDDAGRRGRERVLPDLAASFFVSAPLLPDGQKPDTLPERALRELVALP
jgi:DNA primase